ncbi:alcohol dehydrogenase catalytic domain-containing protein [Amycolatopsis sp. NPDC047767]|uniref:alcohol dehydrogenase catalytic domain-containing protein n=1 Tax=Amycolatopsis sp. NPDC047767 TaxID=3156765 RepID=UPI003454AEF8
MRALEQTSLEGPQDLRLITDAPVPAPGRGEVLIRVRAAGVNFADLSQARGLFRGGPQPPYLAGFEASGEVSRWARTSPASSRGIRSSVSAPVRSPSMRCCRRPRRCRCRPAGRPSRCSAWS